MIGVERRMLEGTYDGRMTVTAYVKNKVDGETVFADKILYDDVPCALSFSQTPAPGQTEDAGRISYAATVFCAPELVIPPGCRIEVVQYGARTVFAYSGERAMYPTHQQISVRREARP